MEAPKKLATEAKQLRQQPRAQVTGSPLPGMGFSVAAKTVIKILIGIILNIQITLGNISILTILSLPTYDMECVSIYSCL